MTIPTPFHPSTSKRCVSLSYKDWAGFHSVCHYDTCHEREYFAIREAVGLIDVSPLFKYRVTGPDATDFVDRLITRRIRRAKVGTVVYTVWCNEQGKVLDDGTVTRLAKQEYRITSAMPNLRWFQDVGDGMDVTIVDESDALAALSVQGPRSRALIDSVTGGAVEKLGFFKHTRATLADVPIEITRTGYTGDLGFEVWVEPDKAEAVYEALWDAGQAHAIQAVGLDAMDMTRIEAGFVLLGVDYVSAREAVIPVQLSSPFEIGLGWTVHFEKKGDFIGRRALEAELATASDDDWALVGLTCNWLEIEALFDKFGLPPSIPGSAWRDGRPVYASRNGRQVGRATSGTWSPVLKQNIALASVWKPLSEVGQRLFLELTVEYERHRIEARVVPTPFFDPPRKKSTPGKTKKAAKAPEPVPQA